MNGSSLLLFFPVIPAAVLSAMLCGMAIAALPLMWIAYWLLPPGWMRDLSPGTVFPACMLVAPILLLSGVMGVALTGPEREIPEMEKPTLEQVRERQALFRHLLPNRAAGFGEAPD
ncbi:hypothetical protein KTR66_18910 [Roseococcus sp. SDR]|uniref:hypothetical protein n=1 Tax=Roseococcus sp. SDR TaxID=2835532 RepID=UPI001BD06102|nr:hypothetical protein [Roseococcus sp. SDR]MBS7792078.1 hypothetical protein [Roseococcus sp. SDR]MBV1847392.1 hypothetical protein [Roseococcus sp. SDR]